MKNTEKKFEIEINTIITITGQTIVDMICDGLGGDAIGYWGCIPDSVLSSDAYKNYKKEHPEYEYWDKIVANMLIEGEPILIKVYDDKENHELTLDNFLNGIKLNSQERLWDSDYEDYDAQTVDCIIQYALFNEIVYG